MADENYSSLREAISKIMGLPAGGTQAAAKDVLELAPKTPYSQDLETVAPGGIKTTSAISNTPFDPFAEQNAAQAASLAALQAQNTQLAAQVAPAVAAAAPAALQGKDLAAEGRRVAEEGRRVAAQGAALRASAASKPVSTSGGTTRFSGANVLPAATPIWSIPRDQNMRPINPGARAPWQASQQYWKDLAAYTKAGGK